MPKLTIGRAYSGADADNSLSISFDLRRINSSSLLLIDRDSAGVQPSIALDELKAATAYTDACPYLSCWRCWMKDWNTVRADVDLAGGMRYEFPNERGNHDTMMMVEIHQHGASSIDRAAYRLKVRLHMGRREYPEAVDGALACLRPVGIDTGTRPGTGRAEPDRSAGLNGR